MADIHHRKPAEKTQNIRRQYEVARVGRTAARENERNHKDRQSIEMPNTLAAGVTAGLQRAKWLLGRNGMMSAAERFGMRTRRGMPPSGVFFSSDDG